MIKQIVFLIWLVIGGSSQIVFSQKPVTIKLDNPSFEDYPQAAHTPQGWYDCGFAGESPPDVQPNLTFKVNKVASHGNTYLGLVVRDVNTWEAIGQRLKSPLLKGVNYTFSLDLSRSELYESQSQATKKTVNYITPVIIRIWAGTGYCSKTEMLDETEPVTVGNWKKYTFKFTPKANHTHFMIEAFYKVPTVFPYNGNILVDNASDIVAEEEKPIATAKQPPPPVKTATPKPIKPTKPTTTPSVLADVKAPKTKPTPAATIETVEETAVKNTKLQEGQIIKIEKMQFAPNSSDIQKESFPQLDEVYNLLVTNPTLIVEIGGHTNMVIEEMESIKLSTERAKAVSDYLVNKGIERNRLVARGYGKSKPIVKENSAAANKVNQRVEIKILSING